MLDTGDALIGSGILGNKTGGEAVIAGMNLMGYDAMLLGPKELSLGPDVLRERMELAEFPMLSANAVLSGTEELFAPAYTAVNIEGHRLGIIGLTRVPSEPVAGFEVRDPEQALLRLLPELAEQAETLVVLTNLDFRAARALAGAVPGINLMIAALPNQLPRQVNTLPHTGTLLVTAEQPLPRHSGRRVGRLSLSVEGNGTLRSTSWQSLAMDRQIPDDPQMAELLETFER